MKDSYGQFAPVLDKARAASKDYFNKNENYRTFGRAAEWFVATGWPGPVTAAAAEVQASNVLTDAPAKVIVDKWSVDQAIDWEDKKIKEIYDTLRPGDVGAACRARRAFRRGAPADAPGASGAARRTRDGRRRPLLFLLPLFVLVVGLIVYPFYRAIWLSFTDKLVGYPERFVGLQNYLYLIHDDTFRAVVRNSLVFTVGSVALKVRDRPGHGARAQHVTWRWRTSSAGCSCCPWITSTVIIALTWRWMFDAFPGRGFFNSVLLDARAAEPPDRLHGHAEGAMVAVIVANWWRASRSSACPTWRHAEHPARALRGGVGGRRRRLAALLAHHPARAQAHR